MGKQDAKIRGKDKLGGGGLTGGWRQLEPVKPWKPETHICNEFLNYIKKNFWKESKCLPQKIFFTLWAGSLLMLKGIWGSLH